jgi:alanine racemase
MPSDSLPGRPVWAEIDLSAIASNVEAIKASLGAGTRLCAVVKADAYGHGAAQVAKEALVSGADMFAVAMASEAVALRDEGIEAPILVLGHTPVELANLAADRGFSAAVSSIDEAHAFADAGLSRGKTIGIHLKIDTGMGRLGFAPEGSMIPLRPAMRLVALVSLIRDLPEGASAGYGRSYRAPRRSRIAILPIGYADGLRRALSGKASVGTAQGRARLVGAICMDQCMIDITDSPGIGPGDAVDILGGSGPSAEELADLLGTISYEVLSTVGKRVPRLYVNGSVQ